MRLDPFLWWRSGRVHWTQSINGLRVIHRDGQLDAYRFTFDCDTLEEKPQEALTFIIRQVAQTYLHRITKGLKVLPPSLPVRFLLLPPIQGLYLLLDAFLLSGVFAKQQEDVAEIVPAALSCGHTACPSQREVVAG